MRRYTLCFQENAGFKHITIDIRKSPPLAVIAFFEEFLLLFESLLFIFFIVLVVLTNIVLSFILFFGCSSSNHLVLHGASTCPTKVSRRTKMPLNVPSNAMDQTLGKFGLMNFFFRLFLLRP